MNWKPERGERYWYINLSEWGKWGTIGSTYHTSLKTLWMYREYLAWGNIFRTKSLALKALKDIKKVLKKARKG